MRDYLVTRAVTVPDEMRLSRYRKSPELGPRVLFFSGGTALNGVAQKLTEYTHNSIHLVTPYDSGGSSAKLRAAFDMPAVGDLRSRMMALSDETVLGHPNVKRLFNYRFSKRSKNTTLHKRLSGMVAGTDKLIRSIDAPMRTLICHHLGYFLNAMPASFDLRGASVGNLILVGGYLNQHRELDPIIYLFSKLVNVRGTVRMITDDNYHLAARLSDGTDIVGQHRLTGKEKPKITSSVKSLALSKRSDRLEPVQSHLNQQNSELIGSAELICYPPGSYYSSLTANLLPQGVASAIAGNPGPKVYIPNRGTDPEQYGMCLHDQIDTLLAQLQSQFANPVAPSALLNFIVYDSRFCPQQDTIDAEKYRQLGIEVIDTKLVRKSQPDIYDSDRLVSALLSLS
ncbi:GAK system CofD-like protein [Alteromonas halophila]|uniref:GAK system CofD-like protein n=1 Tax=Alteromonas halophila TaxID=516698 RepID=A0A918JNY5_9ALTE|nr:GAK system CofD-like protein [Alteromonas halophila]GGW93528.1 hypothetical protein GCM10007391_29890 [Alteromonas halophila]